MAERQKRENQDTRQKLIDAGFDLFTQYGFEATTTRMIAQKAGVTLSAISFHFGTKQALYDCIVETIFSSVATVVDDVFAELEVFFGNPMEDNRRIELAWNFIRRLLNIQIETSFASRRKSKILFIFREANFPFDVGGKNIINDLVSKIEIPFARLILIVSGKDDLEWAKVISRTINGAIIGLGEHPSFMEKMFPEGLDQATEDRIQSYVFQFALISIQAAAGYNGKWENHSACP